MNFYNKLIKDLKINNNRRNKGITCSLGRIKGGVNINQVPEYSEMDLDFRFGKEENRQKIASYLKQKIKKDGFKMKNIINGYTFAIDEKNVFIKKFKKIAEKIEKRKIPFVWKSAGSDARYLAEYKIPSIMYQPRSGGYHSEHEWISISSMEKFRKTVFEFLEKLELEKSLNPL